MKGKAIQFAILCCLICGCRNNGKKTLNEFNAIKNEVQKNYINNQKLFNELKSCFALKYIKVIEFRQNGDVNIEYKMGDKSVWKKTVITTNSKEDQSLLKEEGISMKYLLNLKQELNSINAKSIWIIDDYDATKGFEFKKIEIKYLKEFNNRFFSYMVFDRSLDSIESSHYNLLIHENGRIIDKDVIYYYK